MGLAYLTQEFPTHTGNYTQGLSHSRSRVVDLLLAVEFSSLPNIFIGRFHSSSIYKACCVVGSNIILGNVQSNVTYIYKKNLGKGRAGLGLGGLILSKLGP